MNWDWNKYWEIIILNKHDSYEISFAGRRVGINFFGLLPLISRSKSAHGCSIIPGVSSLVSTSSHGSSEIESGHNAVVD